VVDTCSNCGLEVSCSSVCSACCAGGDCGGGEAGRGDWGREGGGEFGFGWVVVCLV
jgi:hypothetical protein